MVSSRKNATSVNCTCGDFTIAVEIEGLTVINTRDPLLSCTQTCEIANVTNGSLCTVLYFQDISQVQIIK